VLLEDVLVPGAKTDGLSNSPGKEPVHLAHESQAGGSADDGSAVVDPVSAQRATGVAPTALKLARVLGFRAA
jgi:hypothetical protein